MVLPFALSLTLLWLYGRSGKCVFYWKSVDETFLSGVAAFGGLLCVVAEEGSVASVLKMSVFIQTTAHDVLLLFSHIEWFLGTFRWEC